MWRRRTEMRMKCCSLGNDCTKWLVLLQESFHALRLLLRHGITILKEMPAEQYCNACKFTPPPPQPLFEISPSFAFDLCLNFELIVRYACLPLVK